MNRQFSKEGIETADSYMKGCVRGSKEITGTTHGFEEFTAQLRKEDAVQEEKKTEENYEAVCQKVQTKYKTNTNYLCKGKCVLIVQ